MNDVISPGLSSLQLIHSTPAPHPCVVQAAVRDRLSSPHLLTAGMITARRQFCFLTAGYDLSSGSNSPSYGGRLQAEGPSTTVLSLATDGWYRYHFRLPEGSLSLKGMQQTAVQSATACERHFIPYWLWGPLTRARVHHHHHCAQTKPKSGWVVWCGEAGWD